MASLCGLFPYPLLDRTNARQRNAVYHFVANGRASGNMYPVGQSVCAWYAGWMAAALAALGDTTEPIKLLDEAVAGAGCFGEMFEINEAKVSMHPWFSTASGNIVYALNQMLVQSRGDQIWIPPAAPDGWKHFSVTLPCYGNILATVAVKNGRLTELTLTPGDATASLQRTVVIPERWVDETQLDKSLITSTTTRDGNRCLVVSLKGKARLFKPAP